LNSNSPRPRSFIYPLDKEIQSDRNTTESFTQTKLERIGSK
ncbi:6014_t:CDS:1, partial [Acaulospora morrowiae]